MSGKTFVEIFHAMPLNPFLDPLCPRERVATMSVDEPENDDDLLNFIFRHTNHVDENWVSAASSHGIRPEPGNHRSTSAGDFITLRPAEGPARTYLVDRIGWLRLP